MNDTQVLVLAAAMIASGDTSRDLADVVDDVRIIVNLVEDMQKRRNQLAAPTTGEVDIEGEVDAYRAYLEQEESRDRAASDALDASTPDEGRV